jgi:DNA repair exonuclease SbcCD ATPase subunit
MELILTNYGVYKHKKFEFDVDKHFTLLHGSSGLGKSTVLDAICFAITGVLKYQRKSDSTLKVELKIDKLYVTRMSRKVEVVYKGERYTGDIAQGILDNIFTNFADLNYLKQNDDSFVLKTPAKQHELIKSACLSVDTNKYKDTIKSLSSIRKEQLVKCLNSINIYDKEISEKSIPEVCFDIDQYMDIKKFQTEKKDTLNKIDDINTKISLLKEKKGIIENIDTLRRYHESFCEKEMSFKISDIDEILIPKIKFKNKNLENITTEITELKYKSESLKNLRLDLENIRKDTPDLDSFVLDKSVENTHSTLTLLKKNYDGIKPTCDYINLIQGHVDDKVDIIESLNNNKNIKKLVDMVGFEVETKYISILKDLNERRRIEREIKKNEIELDKIKKMVLNDNDLILYQQEAIRKDDLSKLREKKVLMNKNYSIKNTELKQLNDQLNKLYNLKKTFIYKCPECSANLLMDNGKLFSTSDLIICDESVEYNDINCKDFQNCENMISDCIKNINEIEQWFNDYSDINEKIQKLNNEMKGLDIKCLEFDKNARYLLDNSDQCSFITNLNLLKEEIKNIHICKNIPKGILKADGNEIIKILEDIVENEAGSEKYKKEILELEADINKQLNIWSCSNIFELESKIKELSHKIEESEKYIFMATKLTEVLNIEKEIKNLGDCSGKKLTDNITKSIQLQLDVHNIKETIDSVGKFYKHRSDADKLSLQMYDILVEFFESKSLEISNGKIKNIDPEMWNSYIDKLESVQVNLHNRLKIVEMNIQYCNECTIYLKKKQEYDRLADLLTDYKDQSIKLTNSITSLEKLSKLIHKAEAVMVENFIENINVRVNEYCGQFFTSDDIFVNLSTSRILKTKTAPEKVQMTLNITLNCRENCTVNTLSGGQVARLELAFFMAMAKCGKILMIDETLASLDQETSEVVINALKMINDDRFLILMICHQSTLGVFDNVIQF